MKRSQQYIASLRKVKNHIFSYMKEKHGYTMRGKHKPIIRKFLEETGLKIPKAKFNTALVELLETEEFKPFLKFKPLPKAERIKKKGDYRKDYVKYICNSAAWKAKREEAFTFYGRECGNCGSKHRLEVHHKTYKNLYNEPMSDLMILCKPCHDIAHKKNEPKFFKKEAETIYPDRKK